MPRPKSVMTRDVTQHIKKLVNGLNAIGNPEEINVSSIAKALGIHHSTVGRHMQKEGIILRQRDKQRSRTIPNSDNTSGHLLADFEDWCLNSGYPGGGWERPEKSSTTRAYERVARGGRGTLRDDAALTELPDIEIDDLEASAPPVRRGNPIDDILMRDGASRVRLVVEQFDKASFALRGAELAAYGTSIPDNVKIRMREIAEELAALRSRCLV